MMIKEFYNLRFVRGSICGKVRGQIQLRLLKALMERLNNALSPMPRYIQTIVTLLLLTISGKVLCEGVAVDEEEDWYQVEYVLFEHIGENREELRFEPLDTAIQREAGYQYYFEKPYFESYPLLDTHLSPAPPEDRILSNAFLHLKRDKSIRVFEYRAWQQMIPGDSPLLPLRVHHTLEDGRILEGDVTIRRERYLHVDVDVWQYREQLFESISWLDWVAQPSLITLPELLIPRDPPVAAEGDDISDMPMVLLDDVSTMSATSDIEVGEAVDLPNAELLLEPLPFERVHFKASRRVKNEELHYLDHPALGLITTIKKVPSPNTLEETSLDTSATL